MQTARGIPRAVFLIRYGVLDNVRDLLEHDAAVEGSLALGAEGDRTGSHREERVVLAHADVLARLYLGAALADDDHAGPCSCTVSELNAEIFRVRVAQVLC